MAVRCFFVGSVTQLLALAILAIERLYPQARRSWLESTPLLAALAIVLALFGWISTAMSSDRAACTFVCLYSVVCLFVSKIFVWLIDDDLTFCNKLLSDIHCKELVAKNPGSPRGGSEAAKFIERSKANMQGGRERGGRGDVRVDCPPDASKWGVETA